jgi:hypothetical protein
LSKTGRHPKTKRGGKRKRGGQTKNFGNGYSHDARESNLDLVRTSPQTGKLVQFNCLPENVYV